jgi:hypothetical protein
MNVNGLSNAGFMGGLMQGAQFVEGMQNRTKANDRADAQADRAQESHDQAIKLNGLKIDEAETKKLQREFGLMTRKIRLTGEMPSKEEFKKFKPFGVDKLLNSNYIEENQNAGAAIHKARTTGEWGADAITALNTTFFDKLREKEKNTGEKHRVVDAQDMGDGRFGLMLEITGKDGKKRIAPLTKNGTPDKDDNLVLFDENKMDEIHQVQLHRANMAYLWEKNKNDPKAAADFLDGIVFPAKAKKAPGLESIYDKETGGDQKVIWDGSKYVPIGGVKSDNGKGGRGGSGRGGSDGSDVIDWKEFRDKRAAALKEGDPAMLDQVDAMFESTYGFTVDDFNITRTQFEKDGFYGNPTVQQVRAVVKARKEAEAALMQKSQAGSTGNEVEDSLASQPPPRQLAPNPRIAELEQLMSDPNYPGNARAKFEQEYNQLIAKHHGSGNPKPPQKLSKLDKYKQNLELIQSQIANAQSEEERARLGQLLVKTMTDFNKSPGLSDSAHMAAL